MRMHIEFDPWDPKDLDAVEDLIGRFQNRDAGPVTAPVSTSDTRDPSSDPNDVVVLRRNMAANRSSQLLEALSDEPLTFSDLAARMPNDDDTELSAASMRAVFRNIRRKEQALAERGDISGPVVRTNFEAYESEGGARYYLDPAMKDALDAELGR